jgi:hypothetical protein
MQAATQPEPARKRADGRGKHLWQARRRAAHKQIETHGARRESRWQTPYAKARNALWPWSVFGYPGAMRGLTELIGSRASIHTVKDWCRGRRRPPQWAWQLLTAAIERRIAELQHALALIKKEAGD